MFIYSCVRVCVCACVRVCVRACACVHESRRFHADGADQLAMLEYHV